MEKVTVKAVNESFDGYLRGYKFFKGKAEVKVSDAEFMAKHFGVEIVKPEQPKPKTKPKSKSRKTSSAKKDD